MVTSVCQAAQLLGMNTWSDDSFIALRLGARTRAILATKEGVLHRFEMDTPQVMVKFYKGVNDTEGARQYQYYHKRWFHRIPVLAGNPYVQKSIDGGYIDRVGSYAILEYVKGIELAPRLESGGLSRLEAGIIINDVLQHILVPLWDAGLRFKDCHPGNLVYRPDGRTVLIDTEQMRKDADELLHMPQQWEQRNKHEKSQLSRLPRLMQRIISATGPDFAQSRILQRVKSSMQETNLGFALAALGRENSGAKESADQAVKHFLEKLVAEGLIA